jgi:hypothetical protein
MTNSSPDHFHLHNGRTRTRTGPHNLPHTCVHMFIELLPTNMLLNQEFLLAKLKSSLRTFCGRHHDLVDRYGLSVSQMTTDLSHLTKTNSSPDHFHLHNGRTRTRTGPHNLPHTCVHMFIAKANWKSEFITKKDVQNRHKSLCLDCSQKTTWIWTPRLGFIGWTNP